MPSHSCRKGLKDFYPLIDRISSRPIERDRKNTFKQIMDSIALYNNESYKDKILDIEEVNAQFLINNIDWAFKAWQKHPAGQRANFNEFCNYILPYRCHNEPLDGNIRQQLFEKYQWVYDSLLVGVPLKQVAEKVIADFNGQESLQVIQFYPYAQDLHLFHKMKIGRCDDRVNYFVQVFRAIGIIAMADHVECWGNGSMGHLWFKLKYGNQQFVEGNILDVYRKASLPKAYRKSFETIDSQREERKNDLDVTHEYTQTSNINVPIKLNQPQDVVIPELFIFGGKKGWKNVTYGKIIDNSFCYENIGRNVLYLSGYKVNEKVVAINYPFYLDTCANKHFFIPEENKHDSINLKRKMGFVYPRNHRKKEWLDSLHGVFEGALNKEFTNPVTFYKINGTNSTHLQEIDIECAKPVKYIRFKAANQKSFLASLEFYNKDNIKLEGKILVNPEIKLPKLVFDDNPLTNIGGKNFFVGYELNKPEIIGSIKFQARNDDNHIRKGDLYELNYWDKEWISLGPKYAADTLLIYYNTPQKALYWLKNITRGNEEMPFIMDDSMKQKFISFIE